MTAAAPVWLSEYNALRSSAGCINLRGWTQIELRGDDRAKFLHNLCTNDIKGLPTNAGCEAFLLNVQGKILFYVQIFSGPEALVLLTTPDQNEHLLSHLDRYLIREQVTLHDRSSDGANLLVSGPAAQAKIECLSGIPAPARLYASVEARIANCAVWLRHVEIVGRSDWLLNCAAADVNVVQRAIESNEIARCGYEAFEAARIEIGFPVYGRDITEKNLPQEVGRDARTIHFNKGCYLGQETVARIDALGHVNWHLCGLGFARSDRPSAGLEIKRDDKTSGHVTSASYSPALRAPAALGYVRRELATAGSQLESAIGPLTVVGLPMV